MFVKVSGDIIISEPTQEVVEWIEKNLTLTNPVYVNLQRQGREDTIRRKHVPDKIKSYSIRNGSYIVPFGCLYGLAPLLGGCQREADFAPTHETEFHHLQCSVSLFGYQEKAVGEMLRAKGGLLKAGCGSGKTYMGMEILRRLGLRFLWLCGKGDLLNQTLSNFNKLYPSLDIGTITEGEVKMGRDGTISTVQTLINVDYRLYENEFNVVVVDECHSVVSNPQTRAMYAKVLGRCKARYKYGLTATPTRQDGLTRLIYANIGMSPRGTFRPTYEISDSDTQSLESDYETLELDTPSSFDYLEADGRINYNLLLSYLSEDKTRTRAICQRAKKAVEKESRKVAILTGRVSHAEELDGMLKSMGIKSVLVTGESKKRDRKEALGNPNSWDAIVSTVALFKEGLDIKSLDTILIALPFKDPAGIQQSEGRAERPMEGKNKPLFIFAYDKNIEYCQGVERKMKRVVLRKRK